MNAFCSSIGKVRFDLLRTMGGTSIPNHQKKARELALQQFQKPDYLLGGDCLFVGLQEQLALGCDRPNRSQMIAGQIMLQDRCQPTRCVTADNHRQQIEPGFIYEEDGSPFPDGLFLSLGQRVCHQPSISSAFCCLARIFGFWGVQFSSFRMRLTCAG